jgi:hypothetical protein
VASVRLLADCCRDFRVEIANHQHHLARRLFLRLVVSGEIECRSSSAPAAAAPAAPAFGRRGRHVTVAALHAESRRERLHHLKDLRLRRVLREHLQVLRRRRRLSAAIPLRRSRILRVCRTRNHQGGQRKHGQSNGTADHANSSEECLRATTIHTVVQGASIFARSRFFKSSSGVLKAPSRRE